MLQDFLKIFRVFKRKLGQLSLPKKCQQCQTRWCLQFPRYISFTVKRRRLNTAYVDEESNYLTSCLSCYWETVDYYQDLWDDYYSSIL